MQINLRPDGKSDLGRVCGDCQLCCKLLAVKEIAKKGGERCPHQRFHKGCVIYANRPSSCRVWSCVWLIGVDGQPVEGLRRPDRSHYVIDPLPDFVTVVDHAIGERIRVDVLQVWVDPKYPDSWRDPALRAFLEKLAVPAIIRLGEVDTWGVLLPPQMSPTGEVWERPFGPGDKVEGTHTAADRFAHLVRAG